MELAGCLFGLLEQGGVLGVGLLLLDFLRALPEEQVRADGRAEHGDDQGERIARQLEARQQRPLHDFPPVDMHREGDADIGEQREGQPLQHVDVAVIGNEHRPDEAAQREQDRIKVLAAADRELQGGPHG
jgi:hypothetical protein